MPGKGRPRLTPEVYESRLAAYCARYAVKATREGLPPFPTGQRETPQHREWISLYKVHSRLARRARGVCERCSEPVAAGSVFCDTHLADANPSAFSAPTSPEERRRLLKSQSGRCPICAEPLDASAAGHEAGADRATVYHDGATSEPRALLHARCARLVSMAATAGPATLDRLRAFLRPSRAKK
jgi:hypothetical protein